MMNQQTAKKTTMMDGKDPTTEGDNNKGNKRRRCTADSSDGDDAGVVAVAPAQAGGEASVLPLPPSSSLSRSQLLPSCCWKCHGTGRKYQKSTKEYDGTKCGVCDGLGYRTKSKQSSTLSKVKGKIQTLRGYPLDHPKRARVVVALQGKRLEATTTTTAKPAAETSSSSSSPSSSSILFSGPRAVWGRSRFENDNYPLIEKKNSHSEVDTVGQDEAAGGGDLMDWKGLPDELKPDPGEIVASLGCGDWRIFQIADGNKLTVDDFVCAWVACEEMNEKRRRKISLARKPDCEEEDFMFGGIDQHNTTTDDRVVSPSTNFFFTHADLGTGCGSVLQMVLWAFLGQIRSVGVEAQDVSYECLRRGLMWNVGCDPTQPNNLVRIVKGDLRTWDGSLTPSSSSSSTGMEVENETETKESDDPTSFGFRPPYDLITGTPPYFPIDSFVASNNHNQKVRCRVPTRGGACDYVKTASRLLADDGVFCMVEASFQKAETAVLQAVSDTHGVLKIKRRIDVITRTGLKPRFSCWVMTKQEQQKGQSAQNTSEGTQKDDKGHDFLIETLTLRDTNLQRTEEYSRVLERMGWVDFEKYKVKKKRKDDC